jgi:hypothetical protein
MSRLLWLDDCRDPKDPEIDWMMFSVLGRDTEVHWVKDYEEFVEWITVNGLPDGINFDHDLADEHYCTPPSLWDDYEASKAFQEKQNYKEKTGLDCAKWLVDYCIDNNKELPKWYSHSANPVGRDNIDGLLNNFLKNS